MSTTIPPTIKKIGTDVVVVLTQMTTTRRRKITTTTTYLLVARHQQRRQQQQQQQLHRFRTTCDGSFTISQRKGSSISSSSHFVNNKNNCNDNTFRFIPSSIWTNLNTTTTTTTRITKQQQQQQPSHQQQQHNKTTTKTTYRSIHFGSNEYATCFTSPSRFNNNESLSSVEFLLRQNTIQYIQHFQQHTPHLWYDEPITTLLRGKELLEKDDDDDPTSHHHHNNNNIVNTYDAMGFVNGKQRYVSSDHGIEQIIQHINSYQYVPTTAGATDATGNGDTDTTGATMSTTTATKLQYSYCPLRCLFVRYIEKLLLDPNLPFVSQLIGNQCFDYYKQDGITEIIESIETNCIEQDYNDILLYYEQVNQQHNTNTNQIQQLNNPYYGYNQGPIWNMNRQPIYVVTVSNFTNFLDLFRKVLRSLEVSIPVIILSRSNSTTNHTQQHMYRWTKLLVDMIHQYEKPFQQEMKTKFPSSSIDSLSLVDFITFVSCTDEQRQLIMNQCSNSTGTMYATCSRSVAEHIKQQYPNTIASTGGPNTMVWLSSSSTNSKQTTTTNNDNNSSTDGENDNDDIINAIRTSAAIESAGQCTALRHVIVPNNISLEKFVQRIYQPLSLLHSCDDGLRTNQYDGVYRKQHEVQVQDKLKLEGYHCGNQEVDAYYRINKTLPGTTTTTTNAIDTDTNIAEKETTASSSSLEEYWRKVVLDFTPMDIGPNKNDMHQLATWLNKHQPISLAINGSSRRDVLKFGIQLWEQTSMVVTTLGSSCTDHTTTMPVAYTCQARPQDGEIFGEIPPRSFLSTTTNVPVLIPSSNPSYDTHYHVPYLLHVGQQGRNNKSDTTGVVSFSSSSASSSSIWYPPNLQRIVDSIHDEMIRGYCICILEYLRDACQVNPKRGGGENSGTKEDGGSHTRRTTLYGIQRPPLSTYTILRCNDTTTTSTANPFDEIAPMVLLFLSTTAIEQFILSIHPNQDTLIQFCQEHKIKHVVENQQQYNERLQDSMIKNNIYHIITIGDENDNEDNHDNNNNRSRNNNGLPDRYCTATHMKQQKQFPLVGQYVSLFLPMGHIKSTMPNDEVFIFKCSTSQKWLNILF